MKKITKSQNIVVSLILIFSLSFTLGMARHPQERAVQAEVKQVLLRLSTTFNSKNLEGFFSLIDNNYPGLLSFKAGLQDEFLNKKSLDLTFYRDSALEDGDMVLVKLRWLKKHIDSLGNIVKSRGDSQFHFQRTDSGLKLKYITGDNPFL